MKERMSIYCFVILWLLMQLLFPNPTWITFVLALVEIICFEAMARMVIKKYKASWYLRWVVLKHRWSIHKRNKAEMKEFKKQFEPIKKNSELSQKEMDNIWEVRIPKTK